jgi:probable HAF family extracellular repeat protein
VVPGRHILGLFGWLAALAATPVFGGPVYTVADFPTLGGYSSTASAINASAQVAGTSLMTDGSSLAFVASSSGSTPLNPLSGGLSSSASGINASGAVAGTTYFEGSAQATLWTLGGAAGLGTLGGADSYATDVSASGVVVGGASTSTGALHAYTYDGTMRDLGTLGGGNWSAAYAINSSGQVVGYGDAGGGAFSAFLWSATGGMTPLGTLGGRSSYAMDISDSGTVVGHSQVSSGYLHAFLYDGSQMRDLGTLGGNSSFAYDVNSSGQVVGYSYVTGTELTHAFLYSSGLLQDLNSLIAGGSGWILTEAYGIDEAGRIAGSGIYNGEQRAFLLDLAAGSDGGTHEAGAADTPTVHNPEPGSLSLLALGAGLLLVARRIGKFRGGHR